MSVRVLFVSVGEGGEVFWRIRMIDFKDMAVSLFWRLLSDEFSVAVVCDSGIAVIVTD